MEEIYTITSNYKNLSNEQIYARLRCMTLLNKIYEYDEELVRKELQYLLQDWKCIYVASLSNDDTEEQLRKVFKFLGIIQNIEINSEKKSAVIHYENWYNNEFNSHIKFELKRKMKKCDDNSIYSICFVYTVWQDPIVPIRKDYLTDEFYDHYLENHDEIKQIRFYDVYMMPSDQENIPNYENSCKLYENVCYHKDRIKDFIEDSVDEEPMEQNMDKFYPLSFRSKPI